MILKLKDSYNIDREIIFENDENGREIDLYKFEDVMICGKIINYPNTLLYSLFTKQLYKPINETTMSLKNVTENVDNIKYNEFYKKVYEDPLFYFIYNTENYYHFLYDTLPYLITYKIKKQKYKNLKLLMLYPLCKNNFYTFVIEFLEILNIPLSDIIIADENTLYKRVYVSNSFTHDFDSNLPPRKEIYSFFKSLINLKDLSMDSPKKIYVSRRSWLHGNDTNMGTNYTNRRIMENETQVVDYLKTKGFEEIFTENLSIKDKIKMFNSAEQIVGAIGGGLCNTLFSPEDTKLTAIISPNFLDINKRFIYCINKVNLNLFTFTSHTDSSFFKKNMRVMFDDKVGEISKIDGENLHLMYSDYNVVGWSSDNSYKEIVKNYKDCVRIDDGLNCEWTVDLVKFKNCL